MNYFEDSSAKNKSASVGFWGTEGEVFLNLFMKEIACVLSVESKHLYLSSFAVVNVVLVVYYIVT